MKHYFVAFGTFGGGNIKDDIESIINAVAVHADDDVDHLDVVELLIEKLARIKSRQKLERDIKNFPPTASEDGED